MQIWIIRFVLPAVPMSIYILLKEITPTNAGEKGRAKNRLERAKLESQLQNVQRIFEQIPPEILQELKNEKKREHKRKF